MRCFLPERGGHTGFVHKRFKGQVRVVLRYTRFDLQTLHFNHTKSTIIISCRCHLNLPSPVYRPSRTLPAIPPSTCSFSLCRLSRPFPIPSRDGSCMGRLSCRSPCLPCSSSHPLSTQKDPSSSTCSSLPLVSLGFLARRRAILKLPGGMSA